MAARPHGTATHPACRPPAQPPGPPTCQAVLLLQVSKVHPCLDAAVGGVASRHAHRIHVPDLPADDAPRACGSGSRAAGEENEQRQQGIMVSWCRNSRHNWPVQAKHRQLLQRSSSRQPKR